MKIETIQPLNFSPVQRVKAAAFTLAETLIVIGIIGVVAALTLPNLNHATGDKETVTRLMKAYSMLNEANDRAVAIYGPISTWKSNEQCADALNYCWMKRVGEFLKISKSCDERQDVSCVYNYSPIMGSDGIIFELTDGITFAADSSYDIDCSYEHLCLTQVNIDINGKKGKNEPGIDNFLFEVSDTLGVIPFDLGGNIEENSQVCIENKNEDGCTWWVLEFGNLDYLKADSEGNCNDSNIVLDGVTNTSCH